MDRNGMSREKKYSGTTRERDGLIDTVEGGGRRRRTRTGTRSERCVKRDK